MNEVKSNAVSDSNADNKIDGLPYWLAGLLFLVIAIAIGILIIYRWQFPGTWGNQELFAQFGDFVGGTINPILGFATIGLLVWSINIQLKELRDTRREARDSRIAFQEQLDIAKNETSLKQIQIAIDNYESERDKLLARNINTDSLYRIAQKLRLCLKPEKTTDEELNRVSRDVETRKIVKLISILNCRMCLGDFDDAHFSGTVLEPIGKERVKRVVASILMEDANFKRTMNMNLFLSIQISKSLFDYHHITVYKKYPATRLWKNSNVYMEPIQDFSELYGGDFFISDIYQELEKQIKLVEELEINF